MTEERNEKTSTASGASSMSELLADAGYMTAADLQDRARLLSNQSWCRYWLHIGNTEDGTFLMAVQCIGVDACPDEIFGIEKDGFVDAGMCMYYIKRAHEDGTPFKGIFSS